jgi:hypothetical protein
MRKPDYFRRAAIANAIENAVGVRVRDLPITAEKVYGTAASVIAPKLNLVCEDFLKETNDLVRNPLLAPHVGQTVIIISDVAMSKPA